MNKISEREYDAWQKLYHTRLEWEVYSFIRDYLFPSDFKVRLDDYHLDRILCELRRNRNNIKP